MNILILILVHALNTHFDQPSATCILGKAEAAKAGPLMFQPQHPPKQRFHDSKGIKPETRLHKISSGAYPQLGPCIMSPSKEEDTCLLLVHPPHSVC